MLEGLVQGLFENLAELLPVKIVKSYERGVKWTLGRNPTLLDPGPHFRLWFYHSIETAVVADDVIELPIQSVITKDEKLVVFKAIIGFRIEDVVKHFTNVTDFRESTIGLSMTHLAKRIRNTILSEVVGDLTKIETSLTNTLTTKFKDWGTLVNFVGFSDFAEVPTQIRIFGEGVPFVRSA